MEFKELGLSEPVMESLHRLGFTTPTPIQGQAIPPLLQGRDLMGRAETGSGKTLAFGLPLVECVEAGRVSIQALVVCPTRELAQQVAEDIEDAGKEKGVKVALVVGGVHVRTQRLQIPGKQVVVGTPGRIIDLLSDRFLPIEWVEYFVLDEFDRLLDMGFLDDIKRIVKRLPDQHQTALFSATVPKMIVREAQKLLNNPVHVQIGSARRAVDTIKQRAIRTSSARKLAIVEHILKEELENDGSVVIFCNTKKAVRLVDRELWAKNLSVAALSGDHEQSVRFKVMERFRNREIRVLVATDVAARGLDIDHIGHVINFDTPFETEDYVHRIGRTGRAGRDGVVTTLIGNDDYQKFERIRRHIEQDIEMLSENCQPLREQKNRPKKQEKVPAKRRDKESTSGAEDKRKAQETTPTDQGPAARPNQEDEEARPRRARRRARRSEKKVETERQSEAEEVSSSPDQGTEESKQQNSPVSEEEAPAKKRRRSRGASRGKGRRVFKDGEVVSSEDVQSSTEDTDEQAKSRRRRRRTSERRPVDNQDDGKKNDRDTAKPDGERSRRRRRRSSTERKNRDQADQATDQDAKTNTRSDQGRQDATKKDRSQRDSRGRRRRTTERRGGRRSQSDHEKWEREQLDRPVDLIEDNWRSVDEFQKSGDSKKGAAEARQVRSNDNAPAPFEESQEERAALAGSVPRKKSSQRRKRPQDKPQGSQSDSDSSPNPAPKPKPKPKDNDGDIVW